MQSDDLARQSEKALKGLFSSLANELEKLEASNEVAALKYRRLLLRLFFIDKELERRGDSFDV